jgi:hypothetical protein
MGCIDSNFYTLNLTFPVFDFDHQFIDYIQGAGAN